MSENSAEKQRLLIVDDSKVIRVTARKILQQQFETVEAVDGENAWEILSGMGPFALVVSDLTMPKLDGYGLLGKIRSAHDPAISNLPVIVITGDNDSEETMRRAREAGATDFIGKPFDAVHLLARAQSHASTHAERQSLSEQNIALEDQALTDRQTGLANENAFVERGRQQLSYAIRHNSKLAVAQLEIDNYGDLFQQHGDAIAEMMVQHTAGVLMSDIRHEDMAARTGTARFAMLLNGMEQNGIHTLTDRISKDISEHVIQNGNEEIRFTVSIGVCTQDINNDTSFDDLLSIAGNKLRQASADGGNRAIYDSTPDSTPAAANEEETGLTAVDSNPVPDSEASADPAVIEHPVDTSTQAANHAVTEDSVAVMDGAAIAAILAGTAAQPNQQDSSGVSAAEQADETEQQAAACAAEMAQANETVAPVSEPEVPSNAPEAEQSIEASAADSVEEHSTAETGTAQSTSDDQLPEMFAEPITNVSRRLANKVAKARKLAEEEEEIVVSAPFGSYDEEQLAADSQSQAAGIAQETGTNSSHSGSSPATAGSSTTQQEATTTEAVRPGFFRRIAALFSRSAR